MRATALLALAAVILMPGDAAMSQQDRSDDLVPFNLPWDDASGGATNLSGWTSKPAGAAGFVGVRDGHFYAGSQRVRFFGVNLCFGACFPEHTDAEKIAARMARFGINAVRFHHMDNQAAPAGIFKKDLKTLDPAQLDKLDYLVAELKQHGIYANFNLHVSRTYPGQPRWDGMPSFHKGVDLFVPAMVQMQQEYARDLLTHENPYTRTRYVDEPAVAIVEINNENGLLHEWLGGGLENMPAPYVDELTRQWNRWLATHHADDAALRKAWAVKSQPLGDQMLANGDFADGLAGWVVEQHTTAKVDSSAVDGPDGRKAARLQVRQVGRENWHVQFNYSGLKLKAETACTLIFRARADRERQISTYLGMAHEPWQNFWSTAIRLTEQWQQFSFVVPVTVDEPNGRVVFSSMNQAGAMFEFTDVSLRPGGVVGMLEGEQLGHIPIFGRSTIGRRTHAAQRDWYAFLWETERTYWTGMYRYLKDLGVRAPIVGTIVGCSTPVLMAEMDAVDTHAYWQHPRFPGRPWDPADWHVTNTSMVAEPPGTLGRLAMGRVIGKPHLVTEYNHSAPNTYSAEAPLMLAAYGALQDWDGLFLFSYSHRTDDWDAGTFRNFFDIDRHPAKMVNLLPAAAMFVRGDVAPARQLIVRDLDAASDRELLLRRGRPWQLVHAGLLGVPERAPLIHRVGMRLGGDGPNPGAADLRAQARAGVYKSDTGQLVWTSAEGRQVLAVNSPRTRGVIGFSDGGEFKLDGVRIQVGRTRQGWSTIMLSVIEGKSFTAPARILLAATGYIQNTDMAWKDPAKTTVGRDWGKAPTLVEGVSVTITLDAGPADVVVQALDERGQPAGEVKVEDAGGKARFAIGPQFKTLWYEIVIR